MPIMNKIQTPLWHTNDQTVDYKEIPNALLLLPVNRRL